MTFVFFRQTSMRNSVAQALKKTDLVSELVCGTVYTDDQVSPIQFVAARHSRVELGTNTTTFCIRRSRVMMSGDAVRRIAFYRKGQIFPLKRVSEPLTFLFHNTKSSAKEERISKWRS